jgi:tetratricopeptide (TPR) repeat protein
MAGLIFISALALSCHPKEVRVSVSPENVVRANTISGEGDAAYERKEYYAALIKYLEAYGYNPNSENLCNRLGIAYSQLKLYSESIQFFSRAIFLNKKYSYPYNNIGSVYFTQQNYRKAEKYLKKAISLNDKEASFHLNLGSLYLERKKRAEALMEWRKSLQLDPMIFSKRSAVSLSSTSSSLMERHLFIARLFASAGNVESCIENIKLAYANGFSDLTVLKDADFNPVRNDERFVKFLEELSVLIKNRPASR